MCWMCHALFSLQTVIPQISPNDEKRTVEKKPTYLNLCAV